ncbi:Glucoamylase GLA1 [Candida viswanathii]|uniref:glucan 1,4-alpha-glucosidase n=1 Tax=Candida viswanathii TaxID=5486 RepID=A0A367XRT2_9ASCO|nr:Glucoamylase GLA1 [Candida viswanathii]
MKLFSLSSISIFIFQFSIVSALFIPSAQYVPQSLFILASTFIPSLSISTVPVPSNFEDWLAYQEDVSLRSILDNIGGEFSSDTHLLPGVIIASPSKADPDYYYQWTRDAAITLNLVTEQVYKNPRNISLVNLIESYIENTLVLQKIPNRSGSVESYENLGEPKFEVNLTNFDENWGRPQRDGPALRAISIMNYLNVLHEYNIPVLKESTLHNASFIYYEAIKPDLIYSIKYWNQKGFDLWEEIYDYHFFTSLVQLKSLKMGLKYAQYFSDSQSFQNELTDAITKLSDFIAHDSGFINPFKPYVVSGPSIYHTGRRNGLDIATVLASLYTHEDNDTSVPYDIDNGYILTTLSSLVSDMKFRYPINFQDNFLGVALGRYPEDVYDGYHQTEGNPWFISTATASEFIYRFIYNLRTNKKDIVINNSNIDFFKPFLPLDSTESTDDGGNQDDLDELIIRYNTKSYTMMLDKMFNYADGFLKVVQKHVGLNGELSEQFNKVNGYMQGATKLTWSYGAVHQAIIARKKLL